jgi:hypothetical protein
MLIGKPPKIILIYNERTPAVYQIVDAKPRRDYG